MKKNILAIGMIFLFIGIAALPLCSASTPSTVLSTSNNDQPPRPRYFFIKAQIDGTVSGLHQGIFRITAHGPIDLTANALSGTFDQYFCGSSWTISAICTKLEVTNQGNGIYHIKGTVYLCHFYELTV
jgi:hypothetical protein